MQSTTAVDGDFLRNVTRMAKGLRGFGKEIKKIAGLASGIKCLFMARTCWRGSGRQVSSEASSWKVKVCRLDLTEEEVSDLLVPGAGRCFFDGNEKSLINHLRLSFTGCIHPEV